MHQQVVVRIGPLPDLVCNPGGHGYRGNACGADEGIDLLLREYVHQLCQQRLRGGVETYGGFVQQPDRSWRQREAGQAKPPLLSGGQALGLKLPQGAKVHGVERGLDIAAAKKAGPEGEVFLHGEVKLDGVLVGHEMNLAGNLAIAGGSNEVEVAGGGAVNIYQPRSVGEGKGRAWYPVWNAGSTYTMAMKVGAELTMMENRFTPARFKDGYGPVGAWFLLFKAKTLNGLGENFAASDAAKDTVVALERIAEGLARRIADSPVLAFAGILTHPGHSYRARRREDAARVADHERDTVVAFADRLRASGVEVGEVSIGSTPTVMAIALVRIATTWILPVLRVC